MRRHKAQSHHPPSERLGAIVSYAFLQVLIVHIVYVAIYGIHLFILQHPCDASQSIIRSIEVVRVKNTDYLPRGHPDALVHGIIDSLIGFADISHSPLKQRFHLLYHLQGIIFRSPIHNQQFIVVIGLGEHTFQRVPHCLPAIIRSGNDRDFHKGDYFNNNSSYNLI